MATAKTTIELNGKLYDARTGKIIGDASSVERPVKTAARPTDGTVMDGFTRRRTSMSGVPSTQPKPQVARTGAAHTTTRLEKSKTLMRPAVKKPKPIVKSDVTPTRQAVFKKEDPARKQRAAAVPKSQAIQRFNPNATSHRVVKKVAALPVAAPQSSIITQQVAHLATSTETHLRQSVDVIEESLRNASSHLEKFEDRMLRRSFLERFGFRNKLANLAVLSFAGLLLVGFFAWQNAPNLEMRVAATRSGVSAHMPGYSPAGYGVSRNIKSEPGKVSVSFISHTDDKHYTVTQQASNWSSDSLLNNHVLATKQPFQTYQDEGKTVYIYDNSNATWVNGGIWYRVDGNASLTSDQLLRIANSF